MNDIIKTLVSECVIPYGLSSPTCVLPENINRNYMIFAEISFYNQISHLIQNLQRRL